MKKSINYQAISAKRAQNLSIANVTTGFAGLAIFTLSFCEAVTNQEADAGALGILCVFGLVVVLYSLAIKLNK
jgi:hypothetical protein